MGYVVRTCMWHQGLKEIMGLSNKEFNAVVGIQGMMDNLAIDETNKLLTKDTSTIKKDDYFRPTIIDFIKHFHKRSDNEVKIDEDSIKKIENKDFYALELTGKIISKLKTDYSFYDLIIPFGEQILLFLAFMPEHANPEVFQDVKNIAHSIKLIANKN